jgi:hypothetical protein
MIICLPAPILKSQCPEYILPFQLWNTNTLGDFDSYSHDSGLAHGMCTSGPDDDLTNSAEPLGIDTTICTSINRCHVFPFLELAGELRNRIYGTLAEDAQENPVTMHKVRSQDRGYHFTQSAWV